MDSAINFNCFPFKTTKLSQLLYRQVWKIKCYENRYINTLEQIVTRLISKAKHYIDTKICIEITGNVFWEHAKRIAWVHKFNNLAFSI